VTVTLKSADGDEAALDPSSLAVDAGGQVVVRATVRNQSGIVDSYDLVVEGIPDGWATVTPPTVYLVPYGAAGGDYEQDVEIRLRPPRAPQAEARPWRLRVSARSRANPKSRGSADATLTIAPYFEIQSEIRPERASGRHKAQFAIAVRNSANAPCQVEVAAKDAESVCEFRFDQQRFVAQPGHRGGTTFKVLGPKPPVIGQPVDRRIEVSARVVDSDVVAAPHQVVFRQRPWLPPWTRVAVPIVIALIAGAVAYALTRPSTKTVPDLKGMTYFAALKKVEGLGLTLQRGEAVPNDDKKGTILDQAPDPDTSVKEGSAITVKVAVGSGNAPTPDVTGLTIDDAINKLGGLGCFTLNIPTGPDPAKDKIHSQSPAAGIPVQDCSAITPTFLQSDNGGGGGTLPPTLTNLSAGDATAKLTAAGMSPVAVSRFDPTILSGKVISTDPASLTGLPSGSTVRLFVSLGPAPPIVYDNDNGKVSHLLEVSGDGGSPRELLTLPGYDLEPAWNPSGDRLFFQRKSSSTASTIVRLDATNPSVPPTKITDGNDDHRPAVSPDGKVLAFVRLVSAPDNFKLCFTSAVGPGQGPVQCKPTSVSVHRPVWSPDGKVLLVVATISDTQSELLKFVSNRPNSPNPADWQNRGFVTSRMHGPPPALVWSAAFSPDGSALAFTAAWSGGSAYQLVLSPVSAADRIGAPDVTNITGCELSWRSDSAMIAISQGTFCPRPGGPVIAVDPSDPSGSTALTQAGASDPAWQPAIIGS
jgi:beta-lactam-binding protein with PASTA domain